jgi:hypothetical protein
VGPNPTEPASPNNYFRDSLPTQSRRYDVVTSTLSPSEATPSSFSFLKASEKKNEGASNVPTAATTAILEQETVVAEETRVFSQQPPLPSFSSSSPVPSYGALDLFLHSIGANETRRQYRNKIGTFLDFVGLQGTLEQKAELFVQYVRDDAKRNYSGHNNNSGGTANNNNHQWAFAWVVKFILHHKALILSLNDILACYLKTLEKTRYRLFAEIQ